MTELNFNEDQNETLEYVVRRLLEAESGDEAAIRYVEFLWDYDEGLLSEARESLYKESGL